jgi:hypothetical protein
MNLDRLQTKLMAVARATQPSDRVPFAFEKRIMARLTGGAHVDLLAAWSTALWRAAISCLVIVALSGAWSLLSTPPEADTEFSHAFETAVFASAYSGDEAW